MEHLDEDGEQEEEDMDNETMQDIHSGAESDDESESDEEENYEDPDDETNQMIVDGMSHPHFKIVSE